MKLNIEVSTTRNIVFLTFLLVAISLPFSIKINSICIIIAFLAVVIQHLIFKKRLEIKYPVIFYSSIGLFAIHVLSLLYTEDIKQGTFEIEKKLSLLIFPFVILTQNKLSFSRTKTLLLGFSISTIIFLFIQLVRLYFHDPLERVFFVEENGFNLRRAFDMYYDIHPTYLSLYLLFSACVMGYYVLLTGKLWFRSFLTILALICVGFVIALASRIVIACMIMLIPFFIIYHVGWKRRRELCYAVVGLAIVFFVAYSLTPSIKDRFKEVISTESKPPLSKSEMNSTNIRIAVWGCTKHLLSENNLILGLGIGDVQNAMDDCFKQQNWAKELYESKYNLHNQYLQTLAGVGIFGMMLLIIIFLYCGYLAITARNQLLLALMLIICICCLTETVLGTQKGTVFYFFFSNLLCISSFTKEQEISASE